MGFNAKTKIILTRDVTFLQKSYGDYHKVGKPVLVTTSYGGLDDEEGLEMFLIVNQNMKVTMKKLKKMFLMTTLTKKLKHPQDHYQC